MNQIGSVSDIIIAGDLNHDMLQHDTILHEFCNSFGLNNTINKPTRLNPITLAMTLLDVILVLSLEFFVSSGVIHFPLSDHSLCISIFNHSSKKYSPKALSSRFLSEKRLSELRILLSKHKWEEYNSIKDPDARWNQIKSAILTMLDRAAPIKSVTIKEKKVPWINSQLVSLGKKRNMAYHRARKTGISSDWDKFKRYRNLYKSTSRSSKKAFFKEATDIKTNDPAKLWKTVKPKINPNSCNSISSIASGNITIDSSDEIAKHFARSFMITLFGFSLLPLMVCCNFVASHFKGNVPNSDFKFDLPKFNVTDVSKSLSQIDPKSSPGYCGIPSKVFKAAADELKIPITALFNLCIETNRIPSDWKIALVRPHYKGKGEKQDSENYRPISLLSPISKVFESLIASRIYDFCESSSIFNNSQFGFRRKLSCESALNTLIDDWRLSLDNRKNVIAVFLDLRKAFDTVDHTLLIMKLRLYGFSDSTSSLISNYLDGRSYIVQINNSRSEQTSTKFGVPQGSILGPLLFILFINDLCYLKIQSKLVLFADDTTIYCQGDSISSTEAILSEDLDKICAWFEYNRLVINLKKTNGMLFSRLSTSLVSSNLDLKIRGNRISFVETFKLLGVTIDRELKFDEHVSNICKKVNQKSAIISKNGSLFSAKFKEILFKSLVLIHFDYCSSLFISINQTSLSKLEKCFTKALKQVLWVRVSRLNQEEQFKILKPFGILPLFLRLFRHYCIFTFSLIKNGRSGFLLSKLKRLEGVNLRNPYQVPGFNLTVGKHSFSRVAPKLLNSFIFSYLDKNLNIFLNFFDKNIFDLFNINFYSLFR